MITRCWEDVLTPNTIRGQCETCQQDTWVVFYFRCGHVSHKTDTEGHDTVPLDLVRTNVSQITCIACTDTCPLLLVFPTCSHVLCTDCWSNYARVRLDERSYSVDPDHGYSLMCPLHCEQSQVSAQHYQMMSSHHYNRYLRFAAEDLVLSSGGLLCPQPGCGAGILPDTDHDPHCRRQTCAECHYVFCTQCGQGAHLGPCLPCADTDPGHLLSPVSVTGVSQWTGADPSSVTIRSSTKPCPSCR